MYTLICDSGGTKASWLLTDKHNNIIKRIETKGINPVVNSHDTIHNTLASLSEELGDRVVSVVWFYGAGCTSNTSPALKEMLHHTIASEAEIFVNSDLLGAARTLCKDSEGIACILGTGANSCYYDGKDIKQNTPSLGYILGDEGSGAFLGRTLINRLYKSCIPVTMLSTFEKEMGTNLNEIIKRVYRTPEANRYLATFTHFLAAHRNEVYIHDILVDSFELFFVRNIAQYNRPDLPINFVGGVANAFKDELNEAASRQKFTLGKIISSPITELAKYHALHHI